MKRPIAPLDAALLGAATTFFVICAIVAGLTRLGGTATAQDFGSVASGGTLPYVFLYGQAIPGQNSLVYTVPADRVLVMTGGLPLENLLAGSTPKFGVQNYAAITPFKIALGKASFAPGTEVRLDLTASAGSPVGYWYQGYLAEP